MGIPIPGAYASPRIENGVMLWYEGDTFDITILLELEDQDGAAVEIGKSDTVKMTFYNAEKETVHEMNFSNITNGKITLEFTDEVSAKFPKGKYTYDARLTHNNKTTLVRGNRICVE